MRPGHLFLGTHTNNIADRDMKMRTANGRKIRNTAKLTEEIVREIRETWVTEGGEAKAGGAHRGRRLSYSELGGRYGISNPMARNIVLRKNWKHVA